MFFSVSQWCRISRVHRPRSFSHNLVSITVPYSQCRGQAVSSSANTAKLLSDNRYKDAIYFKRTYCKVVQQGDEEMQTWTRMITSGTENWDSLCQYLKEHPNLVKTLLNDAKIEDPLSIMSYVLVKSLMEHNLLEEAGNIFKAPRWKPSRDMLALGIKLHYRLGNFDKIQHLVKVWKDSKIPIQPSDYTMIWTLWGKLAIDERPRNAQSIWIARLFSVPINVTFF